MDILPCLLGQQGPAPSQTPPACARVQTRRASNQLNTVSSDHLAAHRRHLSGIPVRARKRAGAGSAASPAPPADRLARVPLGQAGVCGHTLLAPAAPVTAEWAVQAHSSLASLQLQQLMAGWSSDPQKQWAGQVQSRRVAPLVQQLRKACETSADPAL